jgi:hypothetical protein
MSQVRPRGEKVRTFIIQNVEAHPTDIAKVTATEFGLSRQAVNKHLRNLINEGALIETGATRNKTFKLCAEQLWSTWYHPTGLEEDVVWTNDVNPKLQLPENATRIWNYCVTEILTTQSTTLTPTQSRLKSRKTPRPQRSLFTIVGSAFSRKSWTHWVYLIKSMPC